PVAENRSSEKSWNTASTGLRPLATSSGPTCTKYMKILRCPDLLVPREKMCSTYTASRHTSSSKKISPPCTLEQDWHSPAQSTSPGWQVPHSGEAGSRP